MQNKISYSDIDLTFTIHPVKGDIVLSTNDQAVKRAIKNLIMTAFYERPFHPEIGSSLRKMLFEPMSPISLSYIRKEIYDVITNFEPRAKIIDIIVDTTPDYNAVVITIKFYILSITTPIVLQILLDRVR
jgi:phage baseplate assembly protein W